VSSTTPLMTDTDYPVDKKELVLEQGLPPYAIDESNVELTVGNQRRCFWSRFCSKRCANACEKKKRSPIRRAIRWFLTIFVLLGVSGLFLAKRSIRHHIKAHPIVCVPVTEALTTIELPLHKGSHIGVHPSLARGDAHILYSPDVTNHTAIITFQLADSVELMDAEGDAELFACHVNGPKYTGLGIHRKGKKGEKHHDHHHTKVLSTIVTLPDTKEGHSHGVAFHSKHGKHGNHGRRFGHGCMKKRLRMAIAKAVRLAKAEKYVTIEHADAE